jgi:hypothetical protein
VRTEIIEAVSAGLPALLEVSGKAASAVTNQKFNSEIVKRMPTNHTPKPFVIGPRKPYSATSRMRVRSVGQVLSYR